jgi:hypothetical protein
VVVVLLVVVMLSVVVSGVTAAQPNAVLARTMTTATDDQPRSFFNGVPPFAHTAEIFISSF